jgi:2-methylaconitate cis-trans-isomerase PrpF
MRGGTSKGVFFLEHDLPPAGADRDRLLKRVMGTPDPMQIDGLGGTHLVTSKIAIIARSADGRADVDYTFAQAEIDRDVIDYTGNCGNISAAVGPYAIDAGLVAPAEGTTRVRIRNTNTDKVLVAHVPVSDGRAAVLGDFSIHGVPGTGAEIFMDYTGTIGAKSGRLLPTGEPIDAISLDDGRSLELTLCDVANTVAFIRAADIGLTGHEPPAFFTGAIIDLLREIRGKAAELAGFVRDWNDAETESPFLPFVMLLAPPRQGDVAARMIFMNRCHGSMAGTASMCLAAASQVVGSIPFELSRRRAEGVLDIEHPAGLMDVAVSVRTGTSGASTGFDRLGFRRTARKIMDGMVYIPVR